MLPQFPVKLTFDPASNLGTAPLWEIPAGRILMLLWRPTHLCGADWFMLATKVARRVERERPSTVGKLRACFREAIEFGRQSGGGFADFLAHDVEEFCAEALPYFAGQEVVPYAGEVTGVASMTPSVLASGRIL